MSWDTERAKSGKHPFNWVEFAVDRCIHNYGGTPCSAILGATGADKCYNSWETCQDRESFSSAEYWLRICEPVSEVPRVFEFADDGLGNFIPLLRAFAHDPGMPNPGETMGERARFTATFEDAPHHDVGIDKYAAERVTGEASATGEAFNPQERSTLLRKLKARFPHYVGRRFRWYQGYITANPSLADFRRREYVMERFEGPDASGKASIVSNDLLRLLDNERAQAPAKSQGELTADMDELDAVTTINVETPEPEEYDLDTNVAEDYVRIGDEVFTYTGTTPIAGGVQLTGVTRAAPAPYTTEVSDHDDGDLVQRCRFFRGTVPEVVRELMVDFADIDPSYIPFADWEEEAVTWAPDSIERLVTEPEGVKALVNEIIGQTLTWGFWFDDVDQEIKYRAVRPADVDDDIPQLTDASGIVANSVKLVDLADKIINEVQVLYAQVDPTVSKDDANNYARGVLDASADSQSTNETRQRRVKRVYARWHPAGNSGVVEQFARRTVNSRSQNLVEVQFRLERKDESVGTGGFCDLTTMYIIDALGLSRTLRVQVLKANAKGEELSYRARESFFREQFGRLSPESLNGLIWDDATDAQRERYMFLAQDDGTFTNGDRGKALA